MRIVALFLLMMVLGSCATARDKDGKEVKKVDIVLKNTTDQTLILHAKAGPFWRDIKLAPGESWHGYVPTAFMPDKITILVDVPKKSQ